MQNYMIYLRQGIRWIIMIIVIWFLCNLSKNWLKHYIIESLGGYTEREIVTKLDTTVIEIDSIFPPKRERIVEAKDIKDPIAEYSPSSTIKGNLNELNPKSDSIYRYKTSISDSLIDGHITTLISIKDSKLISQTLNYTPKFPIFVKKTIRIEKTNTEVLKNKDRVKLGIGVILNSNISGGPIVVYQNSKGLQYQAGYIFTKENLDNQFKDKQGYISVSIIKLF